MTNANSTGPLVLGRWQQPAAAVQAGLVPADPYPLENILFCATCGQQFFGAQESGGTDQSGDIQSGATHVAGGSHEPGGADESGGNRVAGDGRVYRTFCEHRPHPIPAYQVELRVYAETHVAAFGTEAVAGLTNEHYALLAVRFFSRVELGSTVDEMTFSARI